MGVGEVMAVDNDLHVTIDFFSRSDFIPEHRKFENLKSVTYTSNFIALLSHNNIRRCSRQHTNSR